MANRDRTITVKIEKLNSAGQLIETRQDKLISGKVDVSPGYVRRKCSFDLAEALPDDWIAHRWKLYYGYKARGDTAYTFIPLGVFIPINPKQTSKIGGFESSYQGIDKSKLFSDYEIPAPLYWATGTTVLSIIGYCAGVVGETKLNIANDLGTLAADFTFEEGTNLATVMQTIISGRNAEWYYDPEGNLRVQNLVPATDKTPKLTLDPSDPIEIESSFEVDDDSYFNKVTVLGGKADTAIYRSTLTDVAAVARAGGRTVSKFFKFEGAVSQTHTDSIAAYYLKRGAQLPFSLHLENLVIPDLETGDVFKRLTRKFEVKTFDVPLGIGTQTVEAGEIL